MFKCVCGEWSTSPVESLAHADRVPCLPPLELLVGASRRGAERELLSAHDMPPLADAAELSTEIVYTIAVSPCGRNLFAGTGHGKLHVWRLSPPPDVSDPLSFAPPTLCGTVQAHGCAIYSLTFAPAAEGGHLLLSGSDEEIRGWRVAELVAPDAAPSAKLQLQNPRGELRRGGLGPLSETSALVLDPSSGVLYSAAGDGNAYAWDLGTQQCTGSFKGHSDLLHCLSVRSRQRQLLSGSEDGTLRLWDVRNFSSTHVLRPDDPQPGGGTASKPVGGGAGCGWCSCLAVDMAENWAVAGWGAG